MENYPHRLFVRMSADGFAEAKALAASLDLSLSELVRLLLRSARPGSGPDSIIVVDRNTAARLHQEMRRWGYHYNQAVHALNSIAYYLRLGEADADDALEELEKVSRKLEALNRSVVALRSEAADVAAHPIACM